jgi:hypothetical protein
MDLPRLLLSGLSPVRKVVTSWLLMSVSHAHSYTQPNHFDPVVSVTIITLMQTICYSP